MKNLLFGLIATLMFSLFGFGKSIAIQLDPSNSKNKYDYIGVMHNKGLDSFINNYKNIYGLESNKKMSFTTLINSNTLYLGQDISINQFNASLIKNNSLLTYLKSIGSSNSTFISAFDAINIKPSNEYNEYYIQMLNAVDGINEKDEASLKTYIELMKNVENTIQVSTLQTNEKDMLLAISSVARYSSSYWFYKTSNSNWNPNNVPHTSCKTIIKWDIAGGAGGAASGAIIGGTVTIPAGGIGAVPGWVAGAITGAVGGSVTEAVYEFLDWLFG